MNSKELEPIVHTLFEFSTNYRTKEHRDELLVFGNKIYRKCLKYTNNCFIQVRIKTTNQFCL